MHPFELYKDCAWVHIGVMMSNHPKRHHHLAQAVQRNFLQKGEDKLWWYSREKDRYEERTTYGIAHGRHTYTFSAVQGEERYALEHAFSKLEDQASVALRRLEQSKDIDQAQHNAISEFIGFQYFRTPSKLDLIKKVRDMGGQYVVQDLAQHLESMTSQQFSSYIKSFENKTGNAITLSQAELIRTLRDRPPSVTSTKEGILDSLIDMGTHLALEYYNRSWVVMHAPDESSFITSSEGLFSSGPPSVHGASPGPAVPGVVTVFPFSRKSALMIEGAGPHKLRHERISKQAVREINDDLATVSGEIYGSPLRLLESIVSRNNLAGTRYEMVPDQDYFIAHLSERLRESREEQSSSSS